MYPFGGEGLSAQREIKLSEEDKEMAVASELKYHVYFSEKGSQIFTTERV